MIAPPETAGSLRFDDVLVEGRSVGVSSSRCYSFWFREMLSLCTIDVAFANPGTEVTVLWGSAGFPQKKIRAIVAPAPYKRDNRRIDVAKLPYRTQS